MKFSALLRWATVSGGAHRSTAGQFRPAITGRLAAGPLSRFPLAYHHPLDLCNFRLSDAGRPSSTENHWFTAGHLSLAQCTEGPVKFSSLLRWATVSGGAHRSTAGQFRPACAGRFSPRKGAESLGHSRLRQLADQTSLSSGASRPELRWARASACAGRFSPRKGAESLGHSRLCQLAGQKSLSGGASRPELRWARASACAGRFSLRKGAERPKTGLNLKLRP